MNILFDFLILGAVGGVCLAAFRILSARLPHSSAYRYGSALALAAAFLLFWANGAVGIIGSEDNDANMMYLGVIAVGFLGAGIARFRPIGMARAMLATALAMVLVAVIALGTGLGVDGPIWPRDTVYITAFFTALWTGSAMLFRHAAQDLPASDGTGTADAELRS